MPNDQQIIITVVSIGIVFIVLVILLVSFLVYFQRKQIEFAFEKKEQEENYKKEIQKSIIEIQDQTLTDIGKEIHDNVGQLLSVVNMQLNSLTAHNLDEKMIDTRNTLKLAINELRSLSRGMNSDYVKNIGLCEAISKEVERIEKLQLFNIEYHNGCDDLKLILEEEIIIFRIFQEFLSNSIKYSKAKWMKINVDANIDFFKLDVSDNGIGFDMSVSKKGSGISNIFNRAKMINADLNFYSEPGKGTTLILTKQYKKENNEKV